MMPVYNTEPDWLREAVKSVEKADLPPAELIIVDDGSTKPETLAMLASLETLGYAVIKIKNSGPSAARNAGFSVAQGDLLLALDSDDLLGPAFCKPAAQELRTRPEVVLVAGAWELFGERSERVAVLPELHLEDFLRANQVSVTSMFRRTAWEELGGFDERLRGAFEDYEWWIRIMSTGGVGLGLEITALKYRLGHESENKLATATENSASNAARRTRESILRNNSARYDALLRASLELLDEIQLDESETIELRRLKAVGSRYEAIDRFLGFLPGSRRLGAELNAFLARFSR